MTSKLLSGRMLAAIILVLLSSVVNLCTSRCEKKEQISAFVDAAIDLMSKVKSVNISCSEDCDSNYGRPLDCMDLYRRGYNKSGVYTIWPVTRLASVKGLEVLCDMDDGGWTVIQRRGNFGRANNFFDQDWKSYKKGFGDLHKDFWIGNDNIFALTNQRLYSVRFIVSDRQEHKAYADYDNFWIDDELNRYTLHISGYSGTAGDAMGAHNNKKFITREDPESRRGTKCGIKYFSGWWFHDCYNANLNGLYNNVDSGIIWFPWKMKMEYLPRVEIKIKPFQKL